MSNFFCNVQNSSNVNEPTDLIYIFNKDKDNTNIIPYTTNMYTTSSSIDLGTYFKNQNNDTTFTTNFIPNITLVDVSNNSTAATFTNITTSLKYISSVSMNDTGRYGLLYVSAQYNDGGGFKSTTDYGSTWNNLPSDTAGSSKQLAIASKDYNYAFAGGYKKLLITKDFGTSWTTVTFPPPPNIPFSTYDPDTDYSVCISSTGKYGFAFGLLGAYYTSDFGVNWTRTNDRSTFWYSSCISSTGQYGFVISGGGPPGSIYYTQNYGKTWNPTLVGNSGNNYGFTQVCISSTGQYGITSGYTLRFDPSANGYTFVGELYYTDNYGLTWSGTNTDIGRTPYTSLSISSTGQYGIACQNNPNLPIPPIYITTNYGKTWSQLVLPLPSTTPSPITSISMSATGQYTIFTSTDGRLYYLKFKTINQNLDLYQKFQPINPAYWSQSDSSGNTWTSVSISSNGLNGLACANPGSIYYTSDSGKTWTQSTTSGTTSLKWTSVSIASNGLNGLACANTGSIYYTSNSGIAWTTSPGTSGPQWSSVSIASNGVNGLACANTGSIYYTSNSGQTWAQSTTSGTTSLKWSSVSIASNGLNGLACANTGSIWYTINSGITWTVNTTTGTTGLQWSSVSISSTGKYGLACGSTNSTTNGYIWYTIDYGKTWTTSNSLAQKWNSVSISGTGQYGISCSSTSSINYLNG